MIRLNKTESGIFISCVISLLPKYLLFRTFSNVTNIDMSIYFVKSSSDRKYCKVSANSVDQDEQSDQGLYCMTVFAIPLSKL